MPYIGRDLNRGNYLKLDDISSSFNGSTQTFNLTVGGSAFTPGSAFSILVSVGGVIQEPESAYQVSNSEITFANAPTAQDSFFCIALGVALGIGVPGNGTVNGTQMSKPFNYDGFFYLNDGTNRVGINSSIPSETLDIVGNTKISGILTASTYSGPIVNSSGISTFYDLRVSNNLTVEGTTTTLDTNLIGVDRIEVGANSNTVVGVAITQSGTADILNLYDGSTEVFSVKDGGSVRVGDNASYSAATNADDLVIGATTGQHGLTILTGNNSSSINFADSAATNPGAITYQHNGTNYMRFRVAGGEKVRIMADGKVGIGTAAPLQKLHVADDTSANIYIETKNGTTGSTAGIYYKTSSSTASGFFKTGIVLEDDGTGYARGKLHILQNNVADSSNATLSNSVVTFTQEGKVGIGITNPSQKFTVQGTILKTRGDSGVGLIYLQHDGSQNGQVVVNQKDGVTRVLLHTDGASYFNGGDVVVNDTTADGNVHPDTKFHVKGGISFRELTSATEAALPAITQWSNNGTSQDLAIGTRSTSGSVIFFTGNSGTDQDWNSGSNAERLRITSDMISGRTDYALARTVGGYTFRETNEGNERAGMHSNASNDLIFKTAAASEKLRITSSGNVGIGTDNPKISGLHVDGVIFAGTPFISSGLQYGGVRLESNHSGSQSGGVIYGGAHNDVNHSIFFRRGYDGTLDTLDINEYGMFRIFTGGALGSQTERLRISGDKMRITAGISSISIGSGADAQRRVDIVTGGDNGVLIRPTTGAEGSEGSSGSIQDLIQLRNPWGSSAHNTGNAGARFGIQMRAYNAAGDFNTKDPAKSAAIYAVSEDQHSGYWKNVGLAFYTSAYNQSQAEKVRIDTNGYVGIGTSDPTAKLEILARGDSQKGIRLLDSNTSQSAPYIEVIGKRSDGNSSQGFGGKIHLAKNRTDAKINNNNTLGSVVFGGNHTDGTEANILYTASISAVASDSFDSATDMPTDLIFLTGSAGLTAIGAVNTSTGTEKLRITSDGKVGIGTNNPLAPVDILTTPIESSTINTTNSIQLGLWVRAKSPSNTTGNIYTGITLGEGRAGLYAYDDGGGAAHGMGFWTGSNSGVSERLRITSDGKVGIGTASPDTPLHIYANDAQQITVERASVNNSGIRFRNTVSSMFAGLTSNATGFAIDDDDDLSSGPMFFVERSTGNIGVNCTPTAAPLEVKQQSDDGGVLRLRDSTDQYRYLEFDVTNALTQITARSNNSHGNIDIGTLDQFGRATQLYIKGGANAAVGIGTDNPDEILHVYNGAGNVTSFVEAIAGDALLNLSNSGNGNFSGINFIRERGSGQTDRNGGSIFMPSNTANNEAFLYIQAQSTSAHAGVTGALSANNGVRLKLHGDDGIFSVETGADERLRIDSNGNIGISAVPVTSGTLYNTVDHFLVIGDSDTGIAQDGDGQLEIWANNQEIANFKDTQVTLEKQVVVPRMGIGVVPTSAGDFGGNSARLAIGDSDTGFGQISDGFLATYTNGVERLRITNVGRIWIGNPNGRSPGSTTAHIQLEGADAGTSAMSITRNSANSGGPQLIFNKTRGTSVGADTVVNNGDTLGILHFVGSDGNDSDNTAAMIVAKVDGSVGSNDVPGRLQFETKTDGGSFTEKLRIHNDAKVTCYGLLQIPNTGTGIKLGPGDSINDDAHIEWLGGNNAGYLRISISDDSDSSGGNEYMEFGDYASQNRGGTFTQHVRIARDQFLVRTGSNTITQADRFKINKEGHVFMPSLNSGSSSDDVQYNSSSGQLIVNASTRLVKTDIEDCSYGLAEINQLKPRIYKRTDADNKVEIGFIADEVQSILPEIVSTKEKSFFTKNESDTEIIPSNVDLKRLTVILTKAIQEQQEQIETLKSKVAALEGS